MARKMKYRDSSANKFIGLLLESRDRGRRDIRVGRVEVVKDGLQELQKCDSFIHAGGFTDEEFVQVLEDLVGLLCGHVGDGEVCGLASATTLKRIPRESQSKRGNNTKKRKEESGKREEGVEEEPLKPFLGRSGIGRICRLVGAGILVNRTEVIFTTPASDTRTRVHYAHAERIDIKGDAIGNLTSAGLDGLPAEKIQSI